MKKLAWSCSRSSWALLSSRCRLRWQQGPAGAIATVAACRSLRRSSTSTSTSQGERRQNGQPAFPSPARHLQSLRGRDRQLPRRAAGGAQRRRQAEDLRQRRRRADPAYADRRPVRRHAEDVRRRQKAGMNADQLKTYSRTRCSARSSISRSSARSCRARRRCRLTTRPQGDLQPEGHAHGAHVLVKTKAQALKVQACWPQQHTPTGPSRQAVLDRHGHQEQRRQPRPSLAARWSSPSRTPLSRCRSTRSRCRSRASTAGT